MDPVLFQYPSLFRYAEFQTPVSDPAVERGVYAEAANAAQPEALAVTTLAVSYYSPESLLPGGSTEFSSFLGVDRVDLSPVEKVNPGGVDLFAGFDATAPDFPTNPFAGAFAPIVSRDPKADPRQRTHDEKVQAILNSLIGRGEIVLIGPGLWRLNPSVARSASRAPNANDDVNDGYTVGTIWVDTGVPAVYILADSTAGAAVWKLVS